MACTSMNRDIDRDLEAQKDIVQSLGAVFYHPRYGPQDQKKLSVLGRNRFGPRRERDTGDGRRIWLGIDSVR